MNALRVSDDDHGEITVTRDGKEIRGWSYKDEAERRMKMFAAREYCEGWGDAVARLSRYTAADGWVHWSGGACPVHVDTLVEVRLRDEEAPRAEPAHNWTWEHRGADDDIISYRIVTPEEVRHAG